LEKKLNSGDNFRLNLGIFLRNSGWSQSHLAKLSGVSQKSISNILSATQSPTLDTVDNLCEPLKVNAWTMIFNPFKSVKPTNVEKIAETLNLIISLSEDDLNAMHGLAVRFSRTTEAE
jgi:transcriptional regulator with XRE-family HTH domain